MGSSGDRGRSIFPIESSGATYGSGTMLGALIAGRYRIRKRIAAGGLATVYEGVIADLGKRVAIKFIDERFADSEEIVERFRLEARAASAIESEHIVQVFDVGEDPRYGLFMVMELLQGEDLGKRLARDARVEIEVAAAVGLQASWALAKAHELGIVHRDLKPENLFLVERTAPGVFVKLLDFGIAKLTRELGLGVGALTANGSTLGTPQYMSPEQIQAAPDIDHRTDIWSLGAVLFEALAGRPVFEEKATFAETLLQICRDRPPRLLDVAPWVPEGLAAVVDHALEPDRAKRLPDARTFATRLLEAAPEPLAAAFAPSSLVMAARALAAPSSSQQRVPIDLGYDDAVTFHEFGAVESDDGTEAFILLGPAGTTVPLELTPLPPAGAEGPSSSRPSSPPSSRQPRSSSLPPGQAYARSLAPASMRPSSHGALRPSYAPRRSSPPRRGGRSRTLVLAIGGALIVALALGDLAVRSIRPSPAAIDVRSAASPRERIVNHLAGGPPRGRI